MVDNNAKMLPNSLLVVCLIFAYQTRSDNIFKFLNSIPLCCLYWVCPRFGGAGILWHLSYLHLMCYYLKLKLRQENQNLKQMINNKKKISSTRIQQSLANLFAIHAEIKQFNDEFWAHYCLSNCTVYLTIICALLYQLMFGQQFALKLLMLYIFVMNFCVISNIWLSSASVAKETVQTKKWLYRLLLSSGDKRRPIDIQVKIKVASCIEKIAFGNIGFYCLDLFMFTYPSYADVSFF